MKKFVRKNISAKNLQISVLLVKKGWREIGERNGKKKKKVNRVYNTGNEFGTSVIRQKSKIHERKTWGER